MNALQIMRPVDVGGVEAVLCLPLRRQRLMQGMGHPVVVDHLRLGVGLVEIGVLPQHLEVLLAPVHRAHPVAGAVRSRHPQQSALSELDGALTGPQHPLDLAGAGKPPGRHLDVAALAVRHRVVPEVLVHVLVHRPERQRVARTGADVEIGGVRRLRRRGRHGKDGVDDEIDGDEVEHAVGQPRELGQDSPAVRDDQRVGHLVPVDPAGIRVRQRTFDDGRADDRQAVSALGPQLLGDPLAQRLRQRVDVRPAQTLGPQPAVVDQPLGHPFAPSLFAGLRDPLRTGLAVLAPSRAHGPAKHFRPT